MIERLQSWLSDSERRARLFRFFWIVSLLLTLLGYAIIISRLL